MLGLPGEFRRQKRPPKVDLDAQIIAAHAAGDKLGLAGFYADAAKQAADLDARCFFLTQAYIFALDAGLPLATDLHKSLKEHGREA